MDEFIFQKIPLFNIWDYISFAYAVCAEGMKTPLDVLFHLIRFRVIIGSLDAVGSYFPGFAGPTTVAAN